MSYSSRNRPRLSDRYRGKSGDEILNELRSQLDDDRKMFFESSPGWNSAQSPGSFSRPSHHPLDDMMSRGRQDIRSHLDDLAQRHPEFADHLRCPPWGGEMGSSSGTWGRKRRGSGSSGDDGCSAYSDPPSQDPVPSEEQSPRGRSRQNNLPQYGLRNTVDLGQQQQQQQQQQCEGEQDKGRGQRSWSAPPDNRTQNPPEPPRFVSRLDIPVNSSSTNATSDQGKPPVAPKHNPQPSQQQPQQNTAPKSTSQGSTVRHIPIFVEGRDEPLLPKAAEVPTEKVFTERTVPQSSFNYGRPSQFTGRPQQQQQHQQPPPPPMSRMPQQSGFAQSAASPKSKVGQSHQQQQQPPQQPAPSSNVKQESSQVDGQPTATAHQPKAPFANDPISRVQAVQKEVDEFKVKVLQYSGNSRKDKDYMYLDEMLTRNLLKLDNIETEGRDDVRQARKAVIRDIQKCISDLESLVPNPEDISSDNAVEMEKPSEEPVSEQISADRVPEAQGDVCPQKTVHNNEKELAGTSELKMETDIPLAGVNSEPSLTTAQVDLAMETQMISGETGETGVGHKDEIAASEPTQDVTPVQFKIGVNDSGNVKKVEGPSSCSSEMQVDEQSKVQSLNEGMEADPSSKDTVLVPKESGDEKSDISPKVHTNPPLNIKLSSKVKSPKGSPKKGKRTT